MAERASIPFVKMQGSGNDFVVINNLKSKFNRKELVELTPKICDRKFGVGADGLLAIQKAVTEGTDYEMLYRNADGSDAGMCGNGSRCLALYASELGMGSSLSFSVHDHTYSAEIYDGHFVTVSFPHTTGIREITVGDESLWQVYTGTEHVVLETNETELDIEEHLVSKGRRLRYHDFFEPQGTNVNFISGQTENRLKLQTYERGVEDLTLACGTGAVASALAWHHKQQLDSRENKYDVETNGGHLKVSFEYLPSSQMYRNLKLSGPAYFVFKGSYYV